MLSLAAESDTEIEVNYKDLTVKFNISGAEFRLTPNGIADLSEEVMLSGQGQPLQDPTDTTDTATGQASLP